METSFRLDVFEHSGSLVRRPAGQTGWLPAHWTCVIPYGGPMEPVYTPVIWIARTLFAAQGLKITISGAKNIPTSGGAVLVSNHPVSYTHLRAHETGRNLVCRLL